MFFCGIEFEYKGRCKLLVYQETEFCEQIFYRNICEDVREGNGEWKWREIFNDC